MKVQAERLNDFLDTPEGREYDEVEVILACNVKGTKPMDEFDANDPNIFRMRFSKGNLAAIVVDLERVRNRRQLIPHAYLEGILDDLDASEAQRPGRQPVVDVWASSSSRIANPGAVSVLARRRVEKGAKFFLWDLGNALQHQAVPVDLRAPLANIILEEVGSIAIDIRNPFVEGLLVLICMGAVSWRFDNGFRRVVWF